MTVLSVALDSGYVVEAFGQVDIDSPPWVSVKYLISDPSEATIFEGTIHMDSQGEVPVGYYAAAMLGVLKGLHEDTDRLMYPHRFDDPKDRGLVIASNEELRLWLRSTSNFFMVAIQVTGSPRMARTIYDNSHYEQTYP